MAAPAAAATAAPAAAAAAAAMEEEEEEEEVHVFGVQDVLNTGPPPDQTRRELVFDSMGKVMDPDAFNAKLSKGGLRWRCIVMNGWRFWCDRGWCRSGDAIWVMGRIVRVLDSYRL